MGVAEVLFREVLPCRNCKMTFNQHAHGKCLYEATSFDPGIDIGETVRHASAAAGSRVVNWLWRRDVQEVGTAKGLVQYAPRGGFYLVLILADGHEMPLRGVTQ